MTNIFDTTTVLKKAMIAYQQRLDSTPDDERELFIHAQPLYIGEWIRGYRDGRKKAIQACYLNWSN